MFNFFFTSYILHYTYGSFLLRSNETKIFMQKNEKYTHAASGLKEVMYSPRY